MPMHLCTPAPKGIQANAVKLSVGADEGESGWVGVASLGVMASFGEFLADLPSFDDSGVGASAAAGVGMHGDLVHSFPVAL